MSKSATSVFVFAIYLAVSGIGFLLIPNTLLGLFGLPTTTGPWVRVIAMTFLILPYYYSRMAEIGIKTAVEEALKNLRRNVPLWLHFDVDALDPEFMPVMFPEPGGLTFEELFEFLRLVWASGRIIGMSIACYHPKLDIDSEASVRLFTLLSNVLSNYS